MSDARPGSVKRRHFLRGAAATVGAAAVSGTVGASVARAADPSAAPTPPASFHGAHQAGIV
ncbi:MAG: twin-arginine translocation signal domain-containing protein, partial [Actinobacteria bacterium]|nr:twin-arginine translocation signal domain-containing protein [Actinomycetota bacterium]